MPDEQTTPDPPPADWPAYWLVCLERAVATGDLEQAAHAQRELRRLGIEVTIRPIRRASTTRSSPDAGVTA
jgi:hypothetical protein